MFEKRITPNRAAKILGVSTKTIYRWADAVLAGERSPIRGVERTANGRLVLDAGEVTSFVRVSYRLEPVAEIVDTLDTLDRQKNR